MLGGLGRMVRPIAAFMIFMLLLLGIGYPGIGTLVAPYIDLTDPGSYDGSIIHGPNGTSASALLGQNITCYGFNNTSSCPYRGLFWSRPTMTDYEPFLGAGDQDPYGPTNPALINETLSYINATGPFNVTTFTAGCGIPIDLVTQSGSGLDPDINTCSALVQIPRISFYDNISEAVLLGFVNGHVQGSGIPGVGTPVVNVVETDFDLIDTYGYYIPLPVG